MAETFACPECGGEVELLGAAPGREVQCAHCASWLEVPYFPRAGVWTRPRFRRGWEAWAIPTAWAGVGLLAVAVAALAWSKATTSRAREARDATLAGLIASAESAEKAGRADRALSEIEAALALLAAGDPSCAERRDELTARRDVLSVREAEGRIAASPKAEAAAAVGDMLSLQARARTDRALEPLVPAILRALDAARRRQADALLADARRALDAGRPLDGLAAGERALAVADKLSGEPARAVADEAERLMAPVLAGRGVIVAQLPGKFTLGSGPDYDAALGPILVDALRRKGYAPRPAAGPACALWDRFASYRLAFQVVESWGVTYLQSQNRLTQVVTNLTLRRGDQVLWQDNPLGRTRVPLPDLPAHAAGRIALANRPDLDMEHRLFEDARAVARDRVAFQLRALPEP